MSTIFPWTLSQRKVKMRTSGFRTPTNQKKHHKGCLPWNVLYKASLYGLLAWTYFYNAKAKFWLQKLALGTGLDIEHIDWSLLTFSFLGWPQNVFSLTYRYATWKNRTRFQKKKKKVIPQGLCISARPSKLRLSLYLILWQIRVFFLNNKMVCPS